MKNIIVPVDFSNHSEYALETAAIIAKKHDATLHVLHMLELSESLISHSSNDNTNEMMFLLALSRKKFEPFLEKEYLKGVKVEAVIKHHKVYKEVDVLAKKINADLIVMGSHGLMAHQGIFAGSNAEKMVRNSTTPVLTIKSAPKNFNLEKVIMATDLSVESVPAYQKALGLFETLGSSVNLVFVNRPHASFISSQEFKELTQKFEKAGGTNQVSFIAGYTIEDGLMQFAEELQADGIAISTHGRKGLSHFFKGSISEDLANHSPLPVMSFKI
ncbi:nucleotide-binding universal stress UspA family protein [Nonlabens dokdonensis]|jgi:nucleotide-binding universal stress UspA family protein|uniref:Universal stress protein n=2 Tax=Nonlabens dokdonensis TaxID=328515 RepID=L7W588_NONDD|nr:universal stress protein [Nonlabens dokdonensis]AGC75317.1 universal stress protein [Nonlabens dokdonensis DSW-6]PZX43025.1 nucleotide-binding universal stress UspA family protein [Nonlabens dokdonensis]